MPPRRLQVWPARPTAAGSVMCGQRSCRPAAGAAPAEKTLPTAALCGAAWCQQQQPPQLPAAQLGSQPTHPPTDLQEASWAEEQEAVGDVLPALTLSMPCTAHTHTHTGPKEAGGAPTLGCVHCMQCNSLRALHGTSPHTLHGLSLRALHGMTGQHPAASKQTPDDALAC